ncbi:tyrosine-type recombinase/integrase [Streptococcus pseudopneumoniae]|uniref:tyrosine-type recombinase/integrase n=1 Tax=Streptococcus pseudopneumoniae TaxID=257758 RepID=UPI00287358AA|nr:tyrosine-type recombinase/integrase [Streptococcus pseudopneumoniae]
MKAFKITFQKANTKLAKPINQPLSSHIFRHTLLSTLAEKNIPLKAIMVRVEHKDAKTINNIYTHVSKRMEQAVLEVLNTISLNRKYIRSNLDKYITIAKTFVEIHLTFLSTLCISYFILNENQRAN